MNKSKTAFAVLLASTVLLGAKPAPAPVDPRVAFVILTGPGFELRVTNEDGTGSATLYKSAAPIRFDLAPRNLERIAVIDGGHTVKLLTYDQNSGGAFTNIQTQTIYTNSKLINSADFSSDGSKLALGVEDELIVYTIGAGTAQTWTTSSYIWDAAWYKNDAAIAFIEPPNGGTTASLFEVTAPGATPTLLLTERDINMVDSSRSNPNALVLSYNRAPDGHAFVGLWASGEYVDQNLAGRTPAWRGTLNCNDSKLMYYSTGGGGQEVWYARTLSLNQDKLYTKVPRVNWTQYWPTCS